MAGQKLLKMENITKKFPGVLALDEVSLEVEAGEIVGLVGENGAGKTTLIEILNPHPAPTGFFRQDSGKIYLEGREIKPRGPREAINMGLSIIHQHLSQVNNLSVAHNLFLGREPTRGPFNTVDTRSMRRQSRRILEELGLNIEPEEKIGRLNIAQRQMIELARALLLDTRVLVVDEITAALNEEDTARIHRVLLNLKDKGLGIIFISHHLEEIFAICDRVVVLRDGKVSGTGAPSELTREDLIHWMVGRDIKKIDRESQASSDELLWVDNLSGAGFVREVSFKLNQGEILGLAGLVGAGRSELAGILFGVQPHTGGRVLIEGKPMKPGSPHRAMEAGLGYVPEDRLTQGLILPMTVKDNLTLPVLPHISSVWRINEKKRRQIARDYVSRLDIATPSLKQRVSGLSGGNQQKVVLGKWLAFEPKILVVDEPTRGIDVGAKSEIMRILQEITARGIGIIMISSELPEIINLSDRILVMCEGRVTGEFRGTDVSQEEIMNCATYDS